LRRCRIGEVARHDSRRDAKLLVERSANVSELLAAARHEHQIVPVARKERHELEPDAARRPRDERG
jgi:hypothetical protein